MLQLCTILIVYFQDSRLMNDVLNYEVLTAIVHYTNNTHTLSAIYFHANNLMKKKTSWNIDMSHILLQKSSLIIKVDKL